MGWEKVGSMDNRVPVLYNAGRACECLATYENHISLELASVYAEAQY